ncbi:MAG: AraC family transcriptional regulator [Clostridiales bacterium]|nr:AraC family transcriptional regulator [Clostridiales bacterium]
MRVKKLAELLGLEELTSCGQDKDVTGVYTCDLLSRVMVGCNEGDAWITVQTHLNVLAVAELSEAACVIIPEGIAVDKDIAARAEDKDIALLSGKLSAYEMCWKLHDILK